MGDFIDRLRERYGFPSREAQDYWNKALDAVEAALREQPTARYGDLLNVLPIDKSIPPDMTYAIVRIDNG